MNVVKGVLTSFRSMHALEGLGVAGTSGITNVCKSSCKALNPCTAISGAGSAGVPQAQLITARIQQLLAANGASVLTRHATPVRNLARFLQTQPNRLHPRAWSLTPHNSLRTQQSAKSRWQRDYYSSAYGRGYGSAWDGDKVLYGLIAANCAGYFLWQSSPGLMSKQATVSINSIREGRLHTLLTSAFSHASLNHLFANMFTFYFFGREIGQTFGGKKVLLPFQSAAQ